MIESVISSGLFGFVSAPILSWIKGSEERKAKLLDIENNKLEMAHELKMLEVQANNTKMLQEMRLAEVEFKSNASLNESYAKVDLARQENLYSGSKKLDAFISSVRPVITYLFTVIFLSVFCLYAFATISLSDNIGDGLATFFDSEFTKGMSYLFANIITFWFGQRLLDKNKK